DLEFTPNQFPPVPPGFKTFNLIHHHQGDDENNHQDLELEPLPQHEAKDYGSLDEEIHPSVEANPSTKPPRPYKSNMFTKHFKKVEGPDGKIMVHCNYYNANCAFSKGDGYGSLSKHLKSKHPSEYGMDPSQQQISRFGLKKEARLWQFKEKPYR